MKSTILILISLLFITGISEGKEVVDDIGSDVRKSFCTSKERKEIGEFWGYDPEDAYRFGIKVQGLVKDRNLEGLISLAEDQISNAPRKRYLKGKKFEDIFSDKWRNSILKDNPSCTPVGWRGYTMGYGHIWYRLRDSKWSIHSFNSWIKEKHNVDGLPQGWNVNGKIIPPQCFVQKRMGGDNYEEIADRFGVASVDFFSNPGKYFGREINKFEPISAWEKFITLTPFLDDCLGGKVSSGFVEDVQGVNEVSLEIKDRVISSRVKETDFSYEILSEIPLSLCDELAPNIQGRCHSSYLIHSNNYSGGSMGHQSEITIYGLFELDAGRLVIVPLKIFKNENNARDFIDDLNLKD